MPTRAGGKGRLRGVVSRTLWLAAADASAQSGAPYYPTGYPVVRFLPEEARAGRRRADDACVHAAQRRSRAVDHWPRVVACRRMGSVDCWVAMGESCDPHSRPSMRESWRLPIEGAKWRSCARRAERDGALVRPGACRTSRLICLSGSSSRVPEPRRTWRSGMRRRYSRRSPTAWVVARSRDGQF